MKSINDNQSSATLICWIGDTDLLIFGRYGKLHGITQYYLTAKQTWENDKRGSGHDFDSEIDKIDPNTRNSSIILTLSESGKNGFPIFSNIILLTNRPSNNAKLNADLRDHYASFLCSHFPSLAGKIEVTFVPSLHDPNQGVNGWEYGEVHEATKKVLKGIIDTRLNSNELWFNVTPGTIAQSTTLILLGKALTYNCNFIQVEKSRRKVYHCEIPFDVSAVINNHASRIAALSEQHDSIIGSAPCFVAALEKAKRIAPRKVTVLLTGPSGTGKEVFAREIHRLSGLDPEKFVPINCAMLSKETGDAELRGYFKGAFTSADKTTPGLLERAKGGTLFLDEIGDCPSDVQATLLRLLMPLNKNNPLERQWTLKGPQPAKLTGEEVKYSGIQKGDIRIIAATNRDIRDPKIFRQDLYYRIETIRIHLPTLEERKSETNPASGIDDIKDLSDEFLRIADTNYKSDSSPIHHFSPDAYKALRDHIWTGNVRELQNAIARIAILTDSETITTNDVLANLNQDETEISNELQKISIVATDLALSDITSRTHTLSQRINAFAHYYCTAALKATNGNKKEAYTIIDTHHKTFNGYLNCQVK